MGSAARRDVLLIVGAVALGAVVAAALLWPVARTLASFFGPDIAVVCGLFTVSLILSLGLICLSLPDTPRQRRR